MKVNVQFKSKIDSLTANSVSDLLEILSTKYKIPVSRLRLKDKSRVLKETDELVPILTVKDLGPQISWKLVFIIEYFGPLMIHPLIYYYFQPSSKQSLLFLILNLLHYLKREYESIKVHRFSHSTMPWTNLPKNCMHYWIFGGFCTAVSVYSPFFKPMWVLSESSTDLLLLCWCWAQVSNLKTHIILRDLRPLGSKLRQIPFGYGFNLVSCPNYFFEIICWVIVSILSGSIWVILFTILGAFQMISWALKKHEGYLKEFPEYPKSRTPIFPFLSFPRSRIK